MNTTRSDALVFFGATGDLAYKKIFPALQAMLKRGHLNVPVIGVAKAGWSLEQFRARAYDSLEKHGGADPAAFAKLSRTEFELTTQSEAEQEFELITDSEAEFGLSTLPDSEAELEFQSHVICQADSSGLVLVGLLCQRAL
jgi:glucose-6-phosphate 1-dehydrogenase